MKNLAKIITPIIIAGSILNSCSSGPRKPTNEDIIIHKEHEPTRAYIEEKIGRIFAEDQQMVLDDEDYILITKGKHHQTHTIYVSDSLYKDVNIGDKFNKKWNYEIHDPTKNLSIENFYKDYTINKK